MQIINLTEPRPTESVSQGRAQQLAILLPLSEVAQLYLTLCNPVGCSPTGSSVHGILQARILELPFPSPGDLPDPGIKPRSLSLQADTLTSEPAGPLKV